MSFYQERDPAIDTLRGVATPAVALLFLGAIFPKPHPLPFRLIATLAPALFVTVAGMLATHSAVMRGRSLSHFASRAIWLFLFGAAIEMGALKLYPFTSGGLLYLVALSLPVAVLAARLPARALVPTAIAILAATPAVQHLFPYSSFPLQLALGSSRGIATSDAPAMALHWLADGQAPIFPWLGFMLAGAALGKLRFEAGGGHPVLFEDRLLWTGAAAVGLGAALWYTTAPVVISRGELAPLSHPPSLGFALSAVGTAFLWLSWIDATPTWKVWRPFRTLGSCPLLLYMIGSITAGWVLPRLETPLTWTQAIGALLFSLVVCGVIASIATRLARRLGNAPLPVRMILGT